MQWMPDGQKILLSVRSAPGEPGDDLSHLPAAADQRGQEARGRDLRVRIFESHSIGEGATPQSDPWPLTGLPIDLVTVDTATGATRAVLRGLDHVGWFSLAPDGRNIALSVPRRFEQPGAQQILWDLELANAVPVNGVPWLPIFACHTAGLPSAGLPTV